MLHAQVTRFFLTVEIEKSFIIFFIILAKLLAKKKQKQTLKKNSIFLNGMKNHKNNHMKHKINIMNSKKKNATI